MVDAISRQINPPDVPYRRTASEISAIRDNLREAIEAGFNGWKDLCSDFAYLDLSTTSRGSTNAFGHNMTYRQIGVNEADPDASWTWAPTFSGPTKMDCYI